MTNAETSDLDVAIVINLVDLCKSTNLMPLAGGLLDQDSLFIDLYEYVAQLKSTRQKLDQRQESAKARGSGRR